MRCPRPTHLLVTMAIALLSASSVIRGCDAGCTVQDAQCYVDTKSRILGWDSSGYVAHASSGGVLTPKYCAQLCKDKNYYAPRQRSFAGVKAGSECFCGNAVAPGAVKVGSNECDQPCRGQGGTNTELCGGSSR